MDATGTLLVEGFLGDAVVLEGAQRAIHRASQPCRILQEGLEEREVREGREREREGRREIEEGESRAMEEKKDEQRIPFCSLEPQC